MPSRGFAVNITAFFITVGLFCAAWYVVTCILINKTLRDRGMNPSFLFLRVMILKYLGQYKEITRKETGRTGPLYYHYLISINAALVAFVLLALTSASR